MRRRTKTTLGVVLLVAGGATVAVGVAGEVGSWGAQRTAVIVRGSAPASGSGSGITTTTTVPPAVAVPQFLDTLGAELRAGNVDGLVAGLNPAVLARYGAAQCHATLTAAQDGSSAFTVKQVGAPARWDWTTDGKTVAIRDALAVDVDQVSRGIPQSVTVHLALVTDRLTWFLDCGDPIGP